MRIKWCILLVLLSSFSGLCQTGGESIFQILNLAPSSRALALGNRVISVRDSDVTLAQINPAIAQSYATHQVSFNHSFYYTGSSYSTISSTYHLSRQQLTLIGGLQSLRHGDIQGADEFGNKTNSFSASENLILIGASKKLFDQVNIGVNFKYILSSLESYHAHGFAIDIGGLYTFSDQFQHVGITVKNLGSQFKSYQTERENLPFDILLGYSKRLAHVPIRFSVTGHHLTTWNLRTIVPEEQTLGFGEPPREASALSKTVDNLFRHLIFSSEIYLGKYAPIRLRLSYDHQRHQELKDQTYRGLSGFGGGIGIKFSKFVVDYGFANYHLAGSINALGISYRW